MAVAREEAITRPRRTVTSRATGYTLRGSTARRVKRLDASETRKTRGHDGPIRCRGDLGRDGFHRHALAARSAHRAKFRRHPRSMGLDSDHWRTGGPARGGGLGVSRGAATGLNELNDFAAER